MRNHPRLYFWLLTALTVLSLLFVLPNSLPLKIKLPFLSINKTLYPLNPNFWFGNIPIKKELTFREGLDLAGGTSVTLEADMSKIPQAQRDNAITSAKEVIGRRVDLYGVSEPLVQTSKVNNSYRLLVDLPGVNVDQAVALVGKTAQLSFWEDLGGTPSANLASNSAMPLGLTQILHNPHQTSLNGKDLQDASVSFDQQTGQPQVHITFTSDGATKFADITKRNVSKPVVIVLDNQIISYPTVQQPILNGDAVINGTFTSDQANQLSIQLRAGALPVPMRILEQSSIGATLGVSYLQKSLLAGILGFLVIVLFMIVLYGRLGVLASCALVLYTLLVLVIFKLIPVTITLAGIAGFILSIGMAVDANILIFERMKEELRLGKSHSIAIELGFSRAWTSIRDSNISTLITSFVLYKFGTGIVQGFALTLAIGVIVSMFSAIVVTRTLIRNFYKK
ncbi:MAG TPA: protein translocase subunit SecD [Candidatus Saccharimonadales bacterium]|nr:protein translocase subunit SecD [Candidatus Saccharimonadales bacterium]